MPNQTPAADGGRRTLGRRPKRFRRGSSRFDKKLEVRAEHFGPGSRIWLRTRGKEGSGGNYQLMSQFIEERATAF